MILPWSAITESNSPVLSSEGKLLTARVVPKTERAVTELPVQIITKLSGCKIKFGNEPLSPAPSPIFQFNKLIGKGEFDEQIKESFETGFDDLNKETSDFELSSSLEVTLNSQDFAQNLPKRNSKYSPLTGDCRRCLHGLVDCRGDSASTVV